jgi:uncharacterized protein with PQ loop repeat
MLCSCCGGGQAVNHSPKPADAIGMLAAFSAQLALVAAVYGVVCALSPTLQIVRMRRAGDSRSLSRGYVAIGAGGYLIWFLYGLSLGNVPLIVSDSIGAAMQIVVLWWAIRLRQAEPAAA